MGRPGETEELMWFAMRVTYHRELEAKRLLDEKGVENFIPMKYEKSARTGKKAPRTCDPQHHIHTRHRIRNPRA